jgi:hypothetical protein
MGSICISDTLRALSDDKSLALFNMVAFNLLQETAVVLTKLGITKKRYYSRMNQLINTGLVTSKSGMYFVTSLAKVVYESHTLIGQAMENYWKFKAIDTIEMSLPAAEERRKMIDTLIVNTNLKNILLNYNVPSNQKDKIAEALRISTPM